MAGRKRRNREGSIFPYRNGWAAYVWVAKPDGTEDRKWTYGKDYDEVRDKWLKLHHQAAQGSVSTSTPTLAKYLAYWLEEIVRPNLAPKTYERYEGFVRLHIVPNLGKKRLNKLQVKDVRKWINGLRIQCQCCTQGKDVKRAERNQRCCAIGSCCENVLSDRSIKDARDCLRVALSHAVEEELVSKNVASVVRLPTPRKQKRNIWTVEEARQFLESAREDRDPLYAAYVLILVLGLRKGEILGLSWEDIRFDRSEIEITHQLQRVHGQLYHRVTKTDSSQAVLPLPDICVMALKVRQDAQECDRKKADDAWLNLYDLVFTTTYGSPYEPRNFNRHFKARCKRAGVPYIKVHDTRRTCGSLLVALDVHPRVAMAILRHSQIKVTMEIYSEVPPVQTRDALKRLGKKLDQER